MLRCIKVTGSDMRMDHRDFNRGGPGINPLSTKCKICGFPNLDQIPKPYYLLRSRTLANQEVACAEVGNLLVGPRVRRVLKLAVPRMCKFYATHYLNTDEKTPWFLCVPQDFGSTGSVRHDVKCCRSCGEPVSAHPGLQYATHEIKSSFDLTKALNWASSDQGWHRWLRRDTLMSVRLFQLFKRLRIRGLKELTSTEETQVLPDEAAWIEDRVALFRRANFTLDPVPPAVGEDADWFDHFLSKHHRKSLPIIDYEAVQDTLGYLLPPSYCRFMESVGPMRFENSARTGLEVTLMPPTELANAYPDNDLIDFDDGTGRPIRPICFATSETGDELCFDVSELEVEYSVYHFRHDNLNFEPFAPDFRSCIRRLMTKDADD